MTAEPSLATTLSGISLPSCVYNASGPRTGSAAALSKIATSASGAVLAKSATVAAQKGNPLPRTWQERFDGTGSALNSEGLPNSGIDYYLSASTVLEATANGTKPYVVSISGRTLADNLDMMRRIAAAVESGVPVAAVELNLACPNVIGKPIIAYDFEQMEAVLQAFSGIARPRGLSLGVKMPPYFDAPHFQAAAQILNRHRAEVSYVATINTVGNALHVDADAEMPTISSNDGYAGLSGEAVKHVALANVRRLRTLLHEEIDVVGVGGVATGRDAFEMILCGAAAVQVGTCHWAEGAGCFDRICTELRTLMKEKGYEKVEDFKGKLRPWSKAGATASREARKKRRQANVVKKNGSDVYMFLCAFLLAVIAFLLDRQRKL